MEHTTAQIVVLVALSLSIIFAAVGTVSRSSVPFALATLLGYVATGGVFTVSNGERDDAQEWYVLANELLELATDRMNRALERHEEALEIEELIVLRAEALGIETGPEEGGRVPLGELGEGELAPAHFDEAVER